MTNHGLRAGLPVVASIMHRGADRHDGVWRVAEGDSARCRRREVDRSSTAPHVFDRIEFRRVPRERLERDPAVVDDAAAVGGQAVPDDEQLVLTSPEAVGVNGLARRPELVTRPASLDDAFPKMKKSHDRPAKGFTVAVKLVHDAGRPRRAIRRGALLAGVVQRIVNEVAPGTDVDLVIPHRYTERLARPPSRRNEVLLRLKDVLKRTGLSRSTLYRLERAREFPKRRELSKNIIAWGEREVLAWMMNRKRRGSDGYRA